MRPFNCLSADCPILGPHLLEASAGTGKTFSIEHVVVRLLLESEEIEIGQILAVTFTRAATRDLKKRIRANLEEALSRVRSGKKGWEYLDSHFGSEKAIEKLERAILTFDRSQIHTIHGFCYRMLQEFAFEADLGFSLPDPDRETAVPKLLFREARKFISTGVAEDLLCPEQMSFLLKDFDSLDEIAERLLDGKSDEAARPFSILVGHFTSLLSERRIEAAELFHVFTQIRPNYKTQIKGNFERQIQAIADSLANPADSLRLLLKEKGTLFDFLSPENLRAKSKDERPEFFQWACHAIGPLIKEAIDKKKIFGCLEQAWKKIEEPILAEMQWFSPDEILKRMRSAIDRESFCFAIRKKIKAVIIDEFQDTDPLQWEIFKTLFLNADYRTQEGFVNLGSARQSKTDPNESDHSRIGKADEEERFCKVAASPNSQNLTERGRYPLLAFYLVGDPKQSIYRFRKADIYTYFEARNLLGSSALFCLDTNYRSSANMIGALNALFDRNWLTLPKLGVAIPSPSVKSSSDISSDFSDEKGAVHFISGSSFEECWLSFAVSEIERLLPILKSPSSFALLVKDRYQAEAALRLFQKRSIPAIAKSHIPLGKTFAFQSVRELFEALAFLKDSSLKRIVEAGPFEALSLSDALSILESRGFISLCKEIVHFGAGSPEFQHDLKQVIEELLNWEGRFGFSFEGLLKFLDDFEHLDPEEGGRRRIDTDADAVQILTLHVSKGLEFDVVFALGLATRQNAPEEGEESKAEKLRQLYVAMTRAKRRLYVPISSVEKSRGSLSPMELFCQTIEAQEGSIFPFLEKIKSITFENLPERIALPPLPIKENQQESVPDLPSIPLVSPCFLHSFTTLAQPKTKEFVKGEGPSQVYSPHTIPKGIETGILIHKIFEKLFSSLTPVWQSVQAVHSLVQDQLHETTLSSWASVIAEMIWKTLNLPLNLDSPFSLIDLMPGQFQVEMEFLFSEPPHWVKGYIDLVFLHAGKFYLVDWKTNWLGPDDGAYLNLDHAMTEHDYWLQAKLYAEGLRRHVKLFYNEPFEELFGGAVYLFLRGGGICHFKPKLSKDD